MTTDDFDSDDDELWNKDNPDYSQVYDWYEKRLIKLDEICSEFINKYKGNICPNCSPK